MSRAAAKSSTASIADTIQCGDAADVLASLRADSVDCVVTSPPPRRTVVVTHRAPERVVVVRPARSRVVVYR